MTILDRGAGRNGLLALKKYGKENVAYFCDNDSQKQRTKVEGIPVIAFDEMLKLYKDGYLIVVTPAQNAYLISQLELVGIYDYLVFYDEELRFVLDFKEKQEKCFKKENDILTKMVMESTKIDLLKNTKLLKNVSEEALRKNKEENFSLFYQGFWQEGQLYGNLQALIEYAGILEYERKYYPELSHNDAIKFYGIPFTYKTAVILSGTYYRDKIHKRAPWVPVFSVGPYIHYAKSIYEKEKITALKQKNGKTLVAFLPHTTEFDSRVFKRKSFIDKLLGLYGNCFETIWLCVYWADINDAVCKYAQEKGIHVVSAGLRWDIDFDRRLKTIFELSDAVVCGDIGTFVSYAIYMQKPIGRININEDKTLNESHLYDKEKQIMLEDKLFIEQFNELFDEELRITDKQKQWMNEVCGFDQIRNAEYIRKIFSITKDIWIQCEGDMNYYPEAVRQVYRQYDKRMEFDKMSILRTAVGAFVY